MSMKIIHTSVFAATLALAASVSAQTCDGLPADTVLGPCPAGTTCQANLANGIDQVIAIHPLNVGNWVIRISPGDRACGRAPAITRINVTSNPVGTPAKPPARALLANHVNCRAHCFGRGTAGDDVFEKPATGYTVTFKGLAGNDAFFVYQRDGQVDTFDGGDGNDDALIYTDPTILGGDVISNIEFIE